MPWILPVNMGSKSGQHRGKRENYWRESFTKPHRVLEVHLIKKQCKSEVSVIYASPSHNWGKETGQDLQSNLAQLMFFTSKWKSINLAHIQAL